MKAGRLLALVGYGRWGANIARQLSILAPGRWAYLVEPQAHRRAIATVKHQGVQASADYDTVLCDSRVVAVLIATPASTHTHLTLKALTAGKHVFVEKPLSVSVDSALELAQTAQARQLTLMVGHIFCYVPAVQRVRHLINAGDLGDIQSIHCERLDWPTVESDIDALWDLGPHDASIAGFLLGNDPVWVTARQLEHQQSDRHHIFKASIGYPEGVAAHLHLSRRDRCRTRRITIVGTRRIAVYDHLDVHHPLKLIDHRGTPYGLDGWTEPRPAEPLALELLHFLECLDTGARPVTDGWEGVKIVALLAAAEVSWRQGRTAVPVSPPPKPCASTDPEGPVIP